MNYEARVTRNRLAACLVALTLAGCAGLTATERDALVAGNAVACSALTLIPVVGPLVATACAGEEQLVRDALDHAVAGQKDGGPEVAPEPLSATFGGNDPQAPKGPTSVRGSPNPWVPGRTGESAAPLGSAQAAIAAGPPPPSPSHVALYHRRGRHRRHVGYAPLRLAVACQAWLDAHPDGVPRPEVAAMPWDGGR